MLNEFLLVINDAKGNISSRRFRKEYFIKQNKNYLWEWFEEQKTVFIGYTDREIVILLQHGYNESPKCIVCGCNSKVQTYTSVYTFDYCSKECSLKSDTRKEKLSNTKKSYSDERKEEIENKRKQTNLEKYGVEYQSQREVVKEIVGNKATKRYLTEDVIYKLNDEEWLKEEYVTKKRDAVDIASELGVYYGTVIDYCKKYNFKIRKTSKNSLPQKQIYEFIKSIYDGEIIYNDWDVLGNLELDIYIPELKIAFEHNGLPSHSFTENSIKAKYKHIDKTNKCESLGIRLIHIRGDHWQKQKDLVKSMIKNVIGVTDRKIYARNCVVKEVSTNDSREFLNDNHLQGFCGGSVKLGLYYNEELISLLIMGTPRNKNNKIKYNWELLRYCNSKYTTVIGGFSKLLKHFRKNYSGSIISYCDRSISNGNVYVKNGFISIIDIDEIEPGYGWTNCHVVYSRESFQKFKLKQLHEDGRLKYYNEKETEFVNMVNNGYRIIYDCGQIPFVLE